MKDFLEEYLRTEEPQKREKSYAWHTAIGLQAVDGLRTSKLLRTYPRIQSAREQKVIAL